jgi:hypothetical protein
MRAGLVPENFRHRPSKLVREPAISFRDDERRVDKDTRSAEKLLARLRKHHPEGDPYVDYRTGIR